MLSMGEMARATSGQDAEPAAPAEPLADITAYECAQRAAATLHRAGALALDGGDAHYMRASNLVMVAAGWRDLGVQLAAYEGLRKPIRDDDR